MTKGIQINGTWISSSTAKRNASKKRIDTASVGSDAEHKLKEKGYMQEARRQLPQGCFKHVDRIRDRRYRGAYF